MTKCIVRRTGASFAALAIGAFAAHAGAQEKIDLATWDQASLYDGISLEDMLGEDVVDPNGEEIGDVRNILVTPDGRISRIIVEAGGFLDIGDTHLAVPWDQLQFDDDAVVVPISEDSVDEFDLFGKNYPEIAQNEWKAFDLLSDTVYLEDGKVYGIVDDIIADTDGRIQAILVQRGGTYGTGEYAYPYSGYYGFRYPMGYGVAPGSEGEVAAEDVRAPGYHLPYAESEVMELGPFDTSRFKG
ncbi:MAG: PRC-barrel domain-containing protein [Geminicoccaceae bacterium]|nr:PRC-barrel domain-containing protein [Geminicoccaceae bacterium]